MRGKNNLRILAFGYYFVDIFAISSGVTVLSLGIQSHLTGNLVNAIFEYIAAIVLFVISYFFFKPAHKTMIEIGKK